MLSEFVLMFLIVPVSFIAIVAMISGDLNKSDLLIIPFTLFIALSISHIAEVYLL